MEAAMIGSNAISAKGEITQGKMTAASLNNQADNLMTQAQEAEDKGKYDAMREQLIAGQKIGTSIAAYGASGVSQNSGSVLDVVQASHQNAELDKLNILHGADVKAINYQNQASMNRFGAQSTLYGAYFAALGKMTGGAIKAASNSRSASPGGSSGGGEEAALDSSGGANAAGADSAGEAASMA